MDGSRDALRTPSEDCPTAVKLALAKRWDVPLKISGKSQSSTSCPLRFKHEYHADRSFYSKCSDFFFCSIFFFFFLSLLFFFFFFLFSFFFFLFSFTISFSFSLVYQFLLLEHLQTRSSSHWSPTAAIHQRGFQNSVARLASVCIPRKSLCNSATVGLLIIQQ